MGDSYLKEFDANVISAKGKYIILDKTSFYPNSGGVEWDTGKIIRKKREKNTMSFMWVNLKEI